MTDKKLAASAANENINFSEDAFINNLTNGNTALEVEVASQKLLSYFNLPEEIQNLSLQEIFENGQISDEELEKLKESHANDNFQNLPTDPNELTDLLAQVESSVKEELLILKTTPLSEEEYMKRFRKVQIQASYQLLAEYMIGQDLKNIRTQHGLKKKSKRRATDNKESKTDIIKKRYPRLGSRQIRDFQNLQLACIWEAIVISFTVGEVPTRKLALSPEAKKKAENQSEEETIIQTSDMKRWHANENDFEKDFKTLVLEKPLNACSLFCNISVGLSLLEKHTNIRIVVANEKDERRGKAHRRLYPNCNTIIGAIDEKDTFDKVVKAYKESGCEFLLASPPCQESSQQNTSKKKGETHRAALFKDTLDVIEVVLPKYIFIENVPQWLESRPRAALEILGDKTIGDYVVDELKRLGYNVNVGILSAADYETGEDRPRAIILACKKELGIWKFPQKHAFRTTVFDVIGSFKSLEAGEVDPNNKWHYGLPLEKCEIEFLSHTAIGCSAWSNSIQYQPKNSDGSPARAQFGATYKRIDPAYPCSTITSDSGQIGGIKTVHFGRPLSNGCVSDSRVLSIAEILRLIGLEGDFLEPLCEKGTSEDDFDGLTWENGMLIGRDESFIRTVLGEHVCPKFMLNIVSTLPIPANDNEPQVKETKTADDSQTEK